MLEVTGLNVFYGDSHVVRDVDLRIPQGRVVCLMGRNGVGKTTLLKTLMG
ncbi:MAG: ATP-binding cassette domain-containing protein, partial [Nitrospiria bacterium]